MYKVDNAVIMAAGTASRFAPLSYEKPKALITVRGEVLIERQIRQLQEAGVPEIYIVTGYKAEMFSYLEEKFGVAKEYIISSYRSYEDTPALLIDYYISLTYTPTLKSLGEASETIKSVSREDVINAFKNVSNPFIPAVAISLTKRKDCINNTISTA